MIPTLAIFYSLFKQQIFEEYVVFLHGSLKIEQKKHKLIEDMQLYIDRWYR